jgi:hypothetical protein
VESVGKSASIRPVVTDREPMRSFEKAYPARTYARQQVRPRRVLGPALARARDLRRRACGAPLAIGYAVQFSDAAVLNARLVKPTTRLTPERGMWGATRGSTTGEMSPRGVLQRRFAQLFSASVTKRSAKSA